MIHEKNFIALIFYKKNYKGFYLILSHVAVVDLEGLP